MSEPHIEASQNMALRNERSPQNSTLDDGGEPHSQDV
jgi:hypothetical protein